MCKSPRMFTYDWMKTGGRLCTIRLICRITVSIGLIETYTGQAELGAQTSLQANLSVVERG